MKTPTIVEVMKAAECHYEKECKYCAIKDECEKFLKTEKYRDCMRMFLAGVIARKLNFDGTPVHGEKPEPAKPPLPKWCKVGQWVFDSCNNLWIIDSIEEYIVELRAYPGSPCSMSFAYRKGSIHPVRFRPYTYEEAKQLIGKVLDYGSARRELVCVVEENKVTGEDMGTERMLFINRQPAECLMFCSIDGHPFGVPEVDEDAMKGETK